MKLISYRFKGRALVGAVLAGRAVDLEPVMRVLASTPPAGVGADGESRGMLALLRAGPEALAAAATFAEGVHRDGIGSHPLLGDVELLAPVPRPPKIVAIGRNYADHAAETGMKALEAPRIISKLPSSATGPGTTVIRPDGIVKLDYEVELAVVIGRKTKNVTLADALSAIAGYTILDDVSARELQFDVSPPQTTFA